jgi:hypothetical protein
LGVTPFAVPHLRPTKAHEDEIDSNAFEAATLKTQDDNKRFLVGKKFSPPKDITDTLKVLNNYICWLEILFGCQCPHLLMVIKLRDAIFEHEDEL